MSAGKDTQILIGGEDKTDRDAIKDLCRAIRPDLKCSFGVVRVSQSLIRGMKPENAKSRHAK